MVDWRWRGQQRLCVCVGGVSLCVVYPAGRDPDRALMSPTIPYPPNSPTSCPGWSDVTDQLGMSRPHPPMLSVSPLLPLSQLGFNHWSPTVTLGQSTKHVPNTDRKARMDTHRGEHARKQIQYPALICQKYKSLMLYNISRASKWNTNKYNITHCVILYHSIICLLFYVIHLFPHSL